ncbi:conjugal transfer protein TraG, partial [Salmonella enterica subsp. enterica]|nr:conjugal transfer protein TraG [Salmonella enterica subsp. enterica serovar Vitkin]
EKMYNEKIESQGHIPGGYSKEELTKMAEDMQKKHRGGKGDS